MTARRLPATALAAVTALTLGACASGEAQNAPGDGQAWYGGESDLTGDLEILGFDREDPLADVRHERAREALGPVVTVTLTGGEFDMEQFLSAVDADTAPDLIYATRSQIGSLAALGAVRPLTDCLDGENIDPAKFHQESLAQVTVNGELFGIPELTRIPLTVANSDQLADSGLSIGDVNGSDPDAMTRAAGELAERQGGGLSAIGVDTGLPEFFPLWAKARGADLLSPDGRSANLDDPAAIEALEWAVSVYEAQGGHAAVEALRGSADSSARGALLAANRLGAMPVTLGEASALIDVGSDAPLAFDAVRTPAGEPVAFAAGQAWAIPSGGQNGTAACRYVAAMTATDSWIAAAEALMQTRDDQGGVFTAVLTGNDQADEEIRGLLSGAPAPWQEGIDAMYAANDAAVAQPVNPADAEFTRIWTEAVTRVLAGEAEPADALAAAQREAQAALGQAWADADAR
jgi:multiple sugar transport system substrate-binding protein